MSEQRVKFSIFFDGQDSTGKPVEYREAIVMTYSELDAFLEALDGSGLFSNITSSAGEVGLYTDTDDVNKAFNYFLLALRSTRDRQSHRAQRVRR